MTAIHEYIQSLDKELAAYEGKIDCFVHEFVVKKLKEKFKK